MKATAAPLHRPCPQELRLEIAQLERRLRTMGLDGDCAYERALSQAYDALLVQKRRELAAIRESGF
ncbi:MAG: hypothetical protein CMN57_07130 [Gammaproteobacteria bacterium]|nr:hypothetical protein [Gammaproteobacteria bacterium]